MSAIEQHIEATRKAINLELDQLLERVKANAAFLAEMNATHVTHDPGTETVAYTATPCEVASLEGIEPLAEPTANFNISRQIGENKEVQELVKRMDLEQTGETPPTKNIIDVLFEQQNKDEWQTVESDSATFHNFCAWLINGEKDTGLPVTDARLFTVQETKKCKFTRRGFDHLQDLMWWRSELKKGKAGDFSLKNILDQNSTTKAEKLLWEALAKTLK